MWRCFTDINSEVVLMYVQDVFLYFSVAFVAGLHTTTFPQKLQSWLQKKPVESTSTRQDTSLMLACHQVTHGINLKSSFPATFAICHFSWWKPVSQCQWEVMSCTLNVLNTADLHWKEKKRETTDLFWAKSVCAFCQPLCLNFKFIHSTFNLQQKCW